MYRTISQFIYHFLYIRNDGNVMKMYAFWDMHEFEF